MRSLIAAILLFSVLPSALAEKILFDVNLSGSSNLGNQLAVFGTLKVDPGLAIDSSNIGASSLQVQRNAETPIRPLNFISLAIANETSGTVQMTWSLVENNLYIIRSSAEDSAITYAGLSLSSPQLPTASFNFGSGVYEHTITYGDSSGIETAILKSSSGPDSPNGFLVGTVASIPEPSSPLCDIETTQSVYVDNEITGLSVLRFSNPGIENFASRLVVELKYDAVGFTATASDVGADGSLIIPAGFDYDFGPLPILPVQAALPRGTWAYRCAVLNPVNDVIYWEDIAEFEIQ